MTETGLTVGAFGAMLGVLVMLSIITDAKIMLRTTLALLGNWCAHFLHWQVFHEPTPYVFSLFIDLLTATVVLTRPAGRTQSVIGATLLFQIGIGVGYAVHIVVDGYSAAAELSYWIWLDWIALGQIVLIAGAFGDGMANHILGSRYRRLVPWYGEIPDAPHRPGVV